MHRHGRAFHGAIVHADGTRVTTVDLEQWDASLQPLYKINTGLEMIVTDEFVVKFKTNLKKADIEMINEK